MREPTKADEPSAYEYVPTRTADTTGEHSSMDALDHLGNVLYMLADLHPDDRCRAYVEALEFYNAARPGAIVAPTEGYETRIVHVTPLDRVLREAAR